MTFAVALADENKYNKDDVGLVVPERSRDSDDEESSCSGDDGYGDEEYSYYSQDDEISLDYLSTIWEETSIDLLTTVNEDSIATIDSTSIVVDHPPSPPRRCVRSSSLSPKNNAIRKRSLSPTTLFPHREANSSNRCNKTNNNDDWITAFFRNSKGEPSGPGESSSSQTASVTSSDGSDEEVVAAAAASCYGSSSRPRSNEVVQLGSFLDQNNEAANMDGTHASVGCGSTIDQTRHYDNANHVSFISIETGEERLPAESDDEYTFVSCTTGSEIESSSHHGRLTGWDEVSSHHRRLSDILVVEDEVLSLSCHGERSNSLPLTPTENMVLYSFVSNSNNADGSLHLHTIPEGDDSHSMAESSDALSASSNSKLQKVLLLEEQLRYRSLEKFQKLTDSPVQRKKAFEVSRERCTDCLTQRKPLRSLSPVISDPLKRKLNFGLNRKQLRLSLGLTNFKLHRPEEVTLMRLTHSSKNIPDVLLAKHEKTASTDHSQVASMDRHSTLKTRLTVERYSGQRRRQSFERSKRMIEKRMASMEKKCRSSSSKGEIPNIVEKIERFGGLQRRESFKQTKKQFESMFEKNIKQFVSPVRRRRSLSPVSRKSFNEKDFIKRMAQSDGNLCWSTSFLDNDEGSDDAEIQPSSKDRDNELVLDPKFEMKRKQRQERFGGLRRRNSFQRSQKMLKKNFDRIRKRNLGGSIGCSSQNSTALLSPKDRERYGVMQRQLSYKQSKVFFQETLHIDTQKPPRSPKLPNEKNCNTNAPELTADEKIERKHSFDSSSTPNVERKAITQRSKSDSHYSYRLSRSRLKGELARQKLQVAFEVYQQRPVLAPDLRTSCHNNTEMEKASIQKLLEVLDKSPKVRMNNPDLTNARKKLQVAFKEHRV